MHTDYAVITGARHTAVAGPCQDYCVAEMLEADRAVAIVADGCSTGGQTDIGARIWAQAAMSALRGQPGIVPAPALHAALLPAAVPLLDRLSLADGYATLGVLQVYGKRVTATIWGDGALLARHRDGTMTLVNLQHTGNAPPYLNYERAEALQAAWALEYEKQELLVETSKYGPAGDLLWFKTSAVPSSFAPWEWSAHVADDELELVMLATDGVVSRKSTFGETACQLLAVRASNGEFMRRRLGRQARDWQCDGSMPGDDLAVAAIWLGA